MRLRDEVAIITGGNSGIGRATAELFAREGAKVVVAARDEKRGEDTVRAIARSGGDGFFISTDVTREAQVRRLVRATMTAVLTIRSWQPSRQSLWPHVRRCGHGSAPEVNTSVSACWPPYRTVPSLKQSMLHFVKSMT